MPQLEDKVCLITGAAGSLGQAITKLFISEGARVALTDLPGQALDDVTAHLDQKRHTSISADITQPDDVQRLVDTTIERFGRLDVIISNAGYFGRIADLEVYPDAAFDQAYAVNVKGPFLLCRAAAKHLGKGASIVIVSSVAATRGDPGVYGYITAKHAQIGLMRCLAKELAPRNIRVNTLNPGPIDNGFQTAIESELSDVAGINATDMFNDIIPLGRHAQPDEIAGSALYLASDLSSFTTGSVLMADGGMSA